MKSSGVTQDSTRALSAITEESSELQQHLFYQGHLEKQRAESGTMETQVPGNLLLPSGWQNSSDTLMIPYTGNRIPQSGGLDTSDSDVSCGMTSGQEPDWEHKSFSDAWTQETTKSKQREDMSTSAQKSSSSPVRSVHPSFGARRSLERSLNNSYEDSVTLLHSGVPTKMVLWPELSSSDSDLDMSYLWIDDSDDADGIIEGDQDFYMNLDE